MKECFDSRQELRILNQNLRNATDTITSRERELLTLRDES